MAMCGCGGEYSVFDDSCNKCGRKKKVGNKAVDVVNGIGDLFGL